MYLPSRSAHRRHPPLQVRTWAPLILVTLVALAACGGSTDDDASPADDNQAAYDDDSTDEPDETDSSSGDQDTSGNYARVTIGSDTYDVPPDGLNRCNSLANMVFGSFAVAADGSTTQAGGTEAAIQVNFGVPVTNWEEEGLQAPTVNLDLLDEGVRWFASVDRGLGSVDSWELADGIATGEATFEAEEVGSGNVLGTASGSFEIVCR